MAGRSRRSEAISHALIVSALAAAASAAEWAQEAIPEIFHHWSWAIHLALLVIVIAAVFMAVMLLETYMQRAARHDPIPIERIGLIDGYWISGVWKPDGARWALIGASVVHIASTAGEGFTLEGEYFAGRDAAGSRSHFSGTGHLAEAGFVYTYDGEGADAERGVGYYEFRKSIAGRQNVRLRGFFIGLGLGSACRVGGRKLSKEEEARLTSEEEPRLLREFLAQAAEDQPAAIAANN